MVKEVLLGIAAEGAEMGFRKLLQIAEGHGPSARSMHVAEHSLDPNVDRKRSQPLEAKKENTVRDLGADPGQAAELGLRFRIGVLTNRVQVDRAARHQLRRPEQVLRAKTELAGTEL